MQICHSSLTSAIKTFVASDCVSSFSELQQKTSFENFALIYGEVKMFAEKMKEFHKSDRYNQDNQDQL